MSKQFDFISRKPIKDRYVYTIKRIADQEEGWGLFNDGWALTGDGDAEYFPIWPTEEAAKKCASNDWESYTPSAIDAHYMVDELLPMLDKDGVHVAIFMVTGDPATATKLSSEFLSDLKNELSKYE